MRQPRFRERDELAPRGIVVHQRARPSRRDGVLHRGETLVRRRAQHAHDGVAQLVRHIGAEQLD